MLTAAELASLRTTLEEALPDLADVYTSTVTPDGSGGYTEETVVRPDMPISCRLSPLSALTQGERELVGRLAVEESLVLTLPAESPVAIRDSIVVYILDPADDTVLHTRPVEVALMLAPRSWELTRRCIVVATL